MGDVLYENESFRLEAGGRIYYQHNGELLGRIRNGSVKWEEPTYDTQRAVSAFIGEAAMHGVSVCPVSSDTQINPKEN